MRLDEGTYKAIGETVVTLMRSNSIGSRFSAPTEVNYRVVPDGETFEVPETTNGFYYRVPDLRTPQKLD